MAARILPFRLPRLSRSSGARLPSRAAPPPAAPPALLPLPGGAASSHSLAEALALHALHFSAACALAALLPARLALDETEV